MLILIPPTTTMDMSNINSDYIPTIPVFQQQAEYVINNFLLYSVEGIAKVFNISMELAQKAYDEYQNFFSDSYKKPAFFAFTGPLYKEMKPAEFTNDEFHFAQEHFRIISSVYGLIKPLDGIKAFRSSFFLHNFKLKEEDMLTFWRDKINNQIVKEAATDNKQILFIAFHDLLKVLNIDETTKDNSFCVVTFKEFECGADKTLREYEKPARGNPIQW